VKPEVRGEPLGDGGDPASGDTGDLSGSGGQRPESSGSGGESLSSG